MNTALLLIRKADFCCYFAFMKLYGNSTTSYWHIYSLVLELRKWPVSFYLNYNKTNSTNLYPPTKGYLRDISDSFAFNLAVPFNINAGKKQT